MATSFADAHRIASVSRSSTLHGHATLHAAPESGPWSSAACRKCRTMKRFLVRRPIFGYGHRFLRGLRCASMGVAISKAETGNAPALGVALSAAAFLAYFDRYLPAAGATLLKHELALSDAQFGLAATTLFAIAYAGTSALAGLLPGAARRWTIACGLALWTAGSAALAFVSSLLSFVCAEIAIGIGQALVLPAAVTVLAGARGATRIGRSTSAFTVGSTLGRSSSVLVAGLLIGWLLHGGAAGGVLQSPWRAVFLLTALPNLVLLGWIATRNGRALAGGNVPEAFRAPLPPARGQQHIAALFISASAAVLVLQAVGIWFPTLIVRSYAIPPGEAAIAVGAVTLVAAPAGQALGGWLVDRRPALRDAPTGLVAGMLLIGCAALWVPVPAPGYAISLALLALVDLVLGIASLAALAGVQAQAREAQRGRANGLFFAAITVTGYGLGPLAVGVLSDADRVARTGLAGALGIAAAGAVVLAGAAHWLAQRAPTVRSGR
jgi:MFS family permease